MDKELSEYLIRITTALGRVDVRFPETEWDEPAAPTLESFTQSAKDALYRFIRSYGVDAQGVRFDIDFCAPEDLVRTLDVNDAYHKDGMIAEWEIVYGYVPGDDEEEGSDTVLESLHTDAHQAALSPLNNLPEPSQAQKESGNYKMGHTTIGGLKIAIENPEGSKRSGVDPDGNEWSITMRSHYGYVKSSLGPDKDHVDVFINPALEAEEIATQPVFIVNQVFNGTKKFDEHKCMLGFATQKAAKAAYLENYEKGWQGIGSMIETSFEGFKKWVTDKKKTRQPATREGFIFESGLPAWDL